jgi:hypothetical protein
VRSRIPPSFCQVVAPWPQARAQVPPVDLGERLFRALNVAQGALQNRAGPDQIASRLMMKRNRQLDQSLEMPSAVAVAGSPLPHVFQGLMGVEEVAGVEEGEAASHVAVVHRF